MKTVATSFVVNLDQVSVRNESLDGIDYLVVPGVGMVEGVHTANAGAVYYAKQELAAYGPEFNSKPAVVYHPKREDGTFISACSPDVLKTYGVGVIYNSREEDGKLKMEFWLNKTKLQTVSKPVYDAVLNNQKVEVSIGLTADLDETAGEFNGEKYAARALNWRPNHVAILPDQKGACSIEKGAGLLANAAVVSLGNEASLTELVSDVRCALYDKMSKPGYYWTGYVEDVYPSFVVYCTDYDGDMFKLDYSVNKDGDVVFSGTPVPVERVVSYQTADGTMIGNASGTFLSNVEVLMKTKKEKVDWLVANSGGDYIEDDRKGLMEFGEKRLDDIVAKVQLANESKDAEAKRLAAEDKAKKDKEAAQVVANTQVQAPAPAQLGTSDYIKTLPPAIQAVINNALAVQAARKAELVANVLKSPTNKFTKEWLEAQDDLNMLEGMAALAAGSVAAPVQVIANSGPPMFIGQNTAIPVLNTSGVPESEKPLPRITIDDVPDRRKTVLANGTAKK